MIIFNPPYLPEETDEETVTKLRYGQDADRLKNDIIDKQWSGGKTGRELIERFAKDVKKFLKDQGKIIMIISSLTGEQEVLELLKKNNLMSKIIERQKIPWEELIVIEAY